MKELYDEFAPRIILTLAGISLGLLLSDRISEKARDILAPALFCVSFGLFLFGIFLLKG